MIENVRGFASSKFAQYREELGLELERLGYQDPQWQILNACSYGVPQLRPRFVLVGFRSRRARGRFKWPTAAGTPPSVGDTIGALMAAGGWPGAAAWAARASSIAPTIVGGSTKHGGPDLGPTRAKAEWRRMGVDALGIADGPPGPDFPLDQFPKLTVPMVARLQGFPPEWRFAGRKTAAYRQVGNAFPPPVAEAIGVSIASALHGINRLRLLA